MQDNFLAMLRACAKEGRELPYAGTLHGILNKKHKPSDPFPLIPVVKEICRALNKKETDRGINLMMFFGLIIELRDAYRKRNLVAKEDMARIVAVMDKHGFINELLAEFKPLAAFQLGFVTSFQEEQPQDVILLHGFESIGIHRKALSLDKPLTPKKLYLFHFPEHGSENSIVGKAEPFFKIGKSHAGMWQCYFYHSAEEGEKDYKLSYISHLDSERLKDEGEKSESPMAKVIMRLTGKVFADQKAPEKKKEKRKKPSKYQHPAGEGQETGRLKLKFLPPLAGVNVAVHESSDEGRELAKTVSRDNGFTEEMELPKGQVVVTGNYQHRQTGAFTSVKVFSEPIDIYKNDKRTLVMNFPYSLEYSAAYMRFMQWIYNSIAFFSRHWKALGIGAVILSVVCLIMLIVWQHFLMPPPRGMIYVPPLKEYETGIIRDDSTPHNHQEKLASNVLRVISYVARHRRIDAEASARAIFNNPPHDYTSSGFYIDKTEVTAERYFHYLEKRKQELSDEEYEKLVPKNWQPQPQLGLSKITDKEFKPYP